MQKKEEKKRKLKSTDGKYIYVYRLISSIFTDGTCINNGRPNAYAGYGIYFMNKAFEDSSQPFLLEPITNNRAEIYAIIRALRGIIKHPTHFDNEITIYSDSQYAIKSIKGLYRSKMNLDLVNKGKKMYEKIKHKTSIKHVKAHTGRKDFLSIGNHYADKLANLGAEKALGMKTISQKSNLNKIYKTLVTKTTSPTESKKQKMYKSSEEHSKLDSLYKFVESS
jgi:ribonuclease HI